MKERRKRGGREENEKRKRREREGKEERKTRERDTEISCSKLWQRKVKYILVL